MSINPLGSGCGTIYRTDDPTINWFDGGYTGREMFLTVNAYEFSDEKAPVITATLKLVQLEDENPNTLISGGSRFFSIELVSYSMGDQYRMDCYS
ncbi:MAG: hypothetical protein E7632_10160 [Ruminococcaceae bacterium]|nr:hypothetical protein [Oscillospiraceae bacterium]